MATPPIPTLEQVKHILGDRVTEWTDEQLIGALAYVSVLAERIPPTPKLGSHTEECAWRHFGKDKKGVLCTCDPERPK